MTKKSPTPPKIDESAASRSTEMPVVVLGDHSGASTARHERLLPGRVDPSWVLTPAYLLILLSGTMVTRFALDSEEWSAGVVIAAWGLLYIWIWVYGIAYRYRRRVMYYLSYLFGCGLAVGLAALTWERAQRGLAVVGGKLVEQPEVVLLNWVWLTTAAVPILITLHMLVLGRGYRMKYRRDTRSAGNHVTSAPGQEVDS